MKLHKHSDKVQFTALNKDKRENKKKKKYGVCKCRLLSVKSQIQQNSLTISPRQTNECFCV